MITSIIKHRVIVQGMVLSAMLHGITLYWLPTLAIPRADSAAETVTLWVDAWRDPHMSAEVAARTITNPPRRSRPVFAQATARAYPDTPIEPPPISQSDAPSSLPTDIAQENEIANHVLGQVLHSVRRYFVYPPFAQRAGWEGEVIVGFRINPDGEIRDVRLIQSSGYSILDEDALLILRRIGSIPEARTWLRGGWYNAQIPVIYRLTG